MEAQIAVLTGLVVFFGMRITKQLAVICAALERRRPSEDGRDE